MKQMRALFAGTFVLWLSVLFVFPFIAYAAESTSDVPIDRAMKEKLRQEIMGNATPAVGDDEYVIGYRDIIYVEIYGEGSLRENIAKPDIRTSAKQC